MTNESEHEAVKRNMVLDEQTIQCVWNLDTNTQMHVRINVVSVQTHLNWC